MQKMLLRLAFSTSSTPKESRKDPSQFASDETIKGKTEFAESSTVDINDLPPPDDAALLIAGIEIPLVWRKKRIVAVDEHSVTEQLRTALETKGVYLYILPSDPNKKNQVYTQLKAALRD